ncbi:MAG: hypothetical protein H0Z29_05560 [Candidatus Marinimicrobia bacterium]|nr:hypothetical protein [Candidatus Neomarinimicrobiota bacterium]
MPIYEDLKNELQEISEILSKFPESIQPKVFDILINNFLGRTGSEKMNKKENDIDKKTKDKKGSKRKISSKETFTIVKDLNLMGPKDKPTFKDFYGGKKPKSNIEFNVVSIYYLKKILNIEKVNLNHIYTCYKEVGRKIPSNLKQSIYDTSGPKYGYIDASNSNDLKLPTTGENLVEHELPRKKKK